MHPGPHGNFLAFDTSTESLSVAVSAQGRVLAHCEPGGQRASAALLPAILDLLGRAGIALAQMDAIVFGSGPGSFTGLRTACSVAQGLAFGTQAQRPGGVPVLPVDTLLAVAEEARHSHGAQQVVAALDARMDEVYCGRYVHADGRWQREGELALMSPQAVQVPAGWVLAGNAAAAYGDRLEGAAAAIAALPDAQALLRLAPQLLRAGHAVAAHLALPLYVRDKVAKTTDERMAERAAALALQVPA